MIDIFAQRVKSARLRAGLSLKALADNLNGIVTPQSLNKYEQGKSLPSSKNLIALASALDVKLDYFFRPARIAVNLSEPAYRKRSKLSEKRMKSIRENVRDLVERYLETENLFQTNLDIVLPEDKQRTVTSMSDVERLTENLRKIWKLGNDPIDNLTQLLEDKSFKVALIEGDEKFDGLSCWANEKIPVIISKKNLPGDRQRSNLAHELGHLIMRIQGGFDEEVAAKRFSGAFLVPAEVARNELGKNRRHLNLEELFILKHKYGMSMQQWVYRAKDLDIISEFHAKQWFIYFRQNDPKKEKGEQIQEEKPTRMKKIVFQALSENIIGPSKAAELLAWDVYKVKELMASW